MKSSIPKSTKTFKLFAVTLTALSTFLIVACVNQNSEYKKNLPTKTMATATKADLAEIGEGHAVYMRHCSQCHEPKLPSSIPTKDWHLIVPGMAWNAGLSAQEEMQVHAYIAAASKYNEMKAR